MLITPTTLAEIAFVAKMDRMHPAQIEAIRQHAPDIYMKWAVGHCEAAERLKKMADSEPGRK